MTGEIIGYVTILITRLADWFNQILLGVDGYGVWITAILVTCSYKFLLRPIFGSAGSDIAKKSYNAFKRRKEQ